MCPKYQHEDEEPLVSQGSSSAQPDQDSGHQIGRRLLKQGLYIYKASSVRYFTDVARKNVESLTALWEELERTEDYYEPGPSKIIEAISRVLAEYEDHQRRIREYLENDDPFRLGRRYDVDSLEEEADCLDKLVGNVKNRAGGERRKWQTVRSMLRRLDFSSISCAVELIERTFEYNPSLPWCEKAIQYGNEALALPRDGEAYKAKKEQLKKYLSDVLEDLLPDDYRRR